MGGGFVRCVSWGHYFCGVTATVFTAATPTAGARGCARAALCGCGSYFFGALISAVHSTSTVEMSGSPSSGRYAHTSSGTNSQGNSYTSYKSGGYSYSNAPSSGAPSGSSYFTPTAASAASGAGFYTAKGGASGGGYSFYQNSSGSRSYK